MGLFDSLKNMFAHHEHHHGASIGQSLTLADAKAILAFIVVHQQLADMRKVADAVKQLQDEMPQYITFGMSHYYSEPKRVRFQSEGASSSMQTPSPPHLPRPPYCRTSAKSSILWAISKTTVSIAIRQRRQQYRLTNSCASPMKGLRPATMRSEVVHGCSPYSISSMTLPRRQRTTWSRLSQRWIRLYKTAPLLLATPPLPMLATAATMPMPAMHVPVSSP